MSQNQSIIRRFLKLVRAWVMMPVTLGRLNSNVEQLRQESNRNSALIQRIKNSTTVFTGDHEALTLLFNDRKMFVDTRDHGVSQSLMLRGVWERDVTDVWRSVIDEDSVVLDIGANFGYFGVVACPLVDQAKGGRVHFIEANKDLTHYIEKTISSNNFSQKTVVSNIALSDKPGELVLNIHDMHWGGSWVSDKSVKTKRSGFHKRYKVEAMTLDNYTKEQTKGRVDVIKMDVEGHEEAIYRGMKKTIKNSPNLKLMLEFTAFAYDDPKKFLSQMQKDFKYLYAISKGNPKLVLVKKYTDINPHFRGGFVMLMASQKKLT